MIFSGSNSLFVSPGQSWKSSTSNPRRSGYIADLRPWHTGADLEKHPGRYVRVTCTSWLLFHFFFSPIFLLEKRDDGENKKKQCVFFVLWSWSLSFFFLPNLLYKGFSIRVIVFWRFFQDVFSMFHVSLRCCRWSPFQNGRPWWGQILHSPILKADWTFFNGTSHIQKKAVTSSNFSGKKHIPTKLLRFFFCLDLSISLKKTTGALSDLHIRWGKQFSFRFPDFVDFSRAIVLPVIEMLVERRGLAGRWEVPSS